MQKKRVNWNKAKEVYSRKEPIDDQLIEALINQPPTENAPPGLSTLIPPATLAYKTWKANSVNEHVQGYGLKGRQSRELALKYSHALASKSSKREVMIHLNNFLDIYRKSSPKVMQKAAQSIIDIHKEILECKDIILPKGTTALVIEAEKLISQACITNAVYDFHRNKK